MGTRRHRSSSTPVRAGRVINPHEIDPRYIEVLRLLEPYYHYKYLTIPWLHYLSKVPVEYSVFRKYLGYLREQPNSYLTCPEQQLASPNVDRKTLVYALAPRGLNELLRRGIVRQLPSKDNLELLRRRTRNYSFAQHRSNSYYHEIIVDLGYFAPLQHLVDERRHLRLLPFPQLIQHSNVPRLTRDAKDPLLIRLKDVQVRFDGTPHVLIHKRENGTSLMLGIPGIQVDRGTQSYRQLEKHLRAALSFVDAGYAERHWGFDNCAIPFLFTDEVRKRRAMEYIRRERGRSAFLLFQSIQDIGLLRHFPKPTRSAVDNDRVDGTPADVSIQTFSKPWQRVGYPNVYLDTFTEGQAGREAITL